MGIFETGKEQVNLELEINREEEVWILFESIQVHPTHQHITCQHITTPNTYDLSTSGDAYLLCKLLLCKEDKRVYNIKDKSLCKLLARYWGCQQQEMVSDSEKGDASETARKVYISYLSFFI